LRNFILALFVIVLAGCSNAPAPKTTTTKTGDPVFDKHITELDKDVVEMGEAAEELTWLDHHVQPLVDRLIETGDRIENTSDQAEKARLRLEFEQITAELEVKEKERAQLFGKEKPKAGAFRFDLKPKSHYGHVAGVGDVSVTEESRVDHKIGAFPRSSFGYISTEWHLTSRIINLDRTCSTTMTPKGVVHVRRALGCNRVMSKADKLPKQSRSRG